jgi:hypothetical protein
MRRAVAVVTVVTVGAAVVTKKAGTWRDFCAGKKADVVHAEQAKTRAIVDFFIIIIMVNRMAWRGCRVE